MCGMTEFGSTGYLTAADVYVPSGMSSRRKAGSSGALASLLTMSLMAAPPMYSGSAPERRGSTSSHQISTSSQASIGIPTQILATSEENLGVGMSNYVEAVDTLRKLSEFVPGWDSYGAKPISSECLCTAELLLRSCLHAGVPKPSVVPTASGGVQIEWHTREIVAIARCP